MVNKIQSTLPNKIFGRSKNTVAGIIFSVLSVMWLQDAVAQTSTFQDDLKKPNIEIAKKDPVIDYMYKNVSSYYPDEKWYIDQLFYQFESQTRLDTALVFLDQIYKEVEKQWLDNKKKLQVVICCFESTLLWWQFYDRHENEIDDSTFDYIMKFDKRYTEFLKRYFDRVQNRMEELLLRIKELDEQSKQLDEQSKQLDEQSKQLDEQSKQLDESISQNFIDIENMMSWFTSADIQKSDHLKKLVIDTYNLTIKAKYTPSKHLLELYSAAKK